MTCGMMNLSDSFSELSHWNCGLEADYTAMRRLDFTPFG